MIIKFISDKNVHRSVTIKMKKSVTKLIRQW